MKSLSLTPNRAGVALAVMLGLGATASVAAETPLMSAAWAGEACKAWNQDPVLTGGLMDSGWIDNDKGRGYKVLQVYRTDCADSPRVELRIVKQDGKAMCAYGGAIESGEPDLKVDYIMHAKTSRWEEMGAGKYGPMKGMMLFRLKFSGPKLEAMGNMGPFTNFLLLAGSVPSDTASCP